LRDEYGFEAFDNISIAPWFVLTPDIPVVRGAQKNQFAIDSLPSIVSKKSIGTATIPGLRMKVLF